MSAAGSRLPTKCTPLNLEPRETLNSKPTDQQKETATTATASVKVYPSRRLPLMGYRNVDVLLLQDGIKLLKRDGTDG